MQFPCHLAVVEDDAGLRADLVEFLTLRGYAVRGFGSAEAFFQAWPETRFDLLLLDVALPGASGLDIAQQVRRRDAMGIIMLTAFDSNDDHLRGLESGADIFLSKRSSLEVIEATCQSVLRRLAREGASGSALANAPAPEADGAAEETWHIDTRRWRLAAPKGAMAELTHAEVLVLSALFEQPGEAISREALLARLDKPSTLSNLRNLDNTVSRLRRKVLEACGAELPVRPSYGKGYTFNGQCKVIG